MAHVTDSDSVAQDQLQAFVRRIESSPRLAAGSPDDLIVMLQDRETRLTYSIAPLVPLLPRLVPNADRAFVEAGRLMGCTTDTAVHRARAWQRKGSLAAVDAAHSSWAGGPLWHVATLDKERGGYVYGMSAVDYPGIVKVGFSRDPEVRCQQLQRDHGVALKLLTYVPGTMLDEHLLQVAMAGQSLANEWFDLDGRWTKQNPLAWVFTPTRMWNEMRGER